MLRLLLCHHVCAPFLLSRAFSRPALYERCDSFTRSGPVLVLLRGGDSLGEGVADQIEPPGSRAEVSLQLCLWTDLLGIPPCRFARCKAQASASPICPICAQNSDKLRFLFPSLPWHWFGV